MHAEARCEVERRRVRMVPVFSARQRAVGRCLARVHDLHQRTKEGQEGLDSSNRCNRLLWAAKGPRPGCGSKGPVETRVDVDDSVATAA